MTLNHWSHRTRMPAGVNNDGPSLSQSIRLTGSQRRPRWLNSTLLQSLNGHATRQFVARGRRWLPVKRCAVLFCVVLSLLPSSAVAVEPFREFLKALQDRGYGDSAADYLSLARSRDDLPNELREVLDLEMATSLRIAAANTANTDEAARYLEAAQRHLDKFVREHPDHPESGMAHAIYGDLASARAEAGLKAAFGSHDKEEQEALFQKGRAAFVEARSAYERGRQAYQTRLDRFQEIAKPAEKPPAHSKPKQETGKGDRESIEARLVQVRFKLAMVDYQVAKTYLDAASPERKEALEQAAHGFDDLYQRYRTFQAGLYAHFWQGKTLIELGDMNTALDIFDEVLANAPEGQERTDDSSFDDLFAQVEQMRLAILTRQGHADEAIAEAEEWLRENKSNQRSDSYQGVALEMAKAQLAKAESQAGEPRRKSMQAVKVALAKIAAKVSAHQQEAILLQRQLRAQGDDAEPTSFDEAVAVANAAAAAGDWEAAIAGYTRAIELGRDGKKASQAHELRLALARAQWSAGKIAECLDTAESLVLDNTAGEQASAAAALAIHAALKLATANRESATARERLSRVADAILRRWPQRVEADEARMALGKMALVKGDDDQALAVFEAVNSASQRYPSALHWSAVVHWRRYLHAKAQPDEKRDISAIAADRTRAIEQLTASLKAQRATTLSAAPPREQLESQVLLAEIDLEGGQLDEAATLLEPLVPVMRALPPSEQVTLSTRALIAALRVQILRKDVPHANEAAAALVERGGNSPQSDAILLEFARMLRKEVKQVADAEPSEASPSPDDRAPRRELLLKVLEHLAQRPQPSAAAMIFVAESLADLGQADEARAQYQSILERADKDPQWLEADRSLQTRVRARLLSFLRAEGRYEQALAQADRLVQENPKALEPRIERAQILQSWAEIEPDRYPQAVTQWTELRTALQNVRPRPKEYYDAVYNAAICLAAHSKHSGDKTPARQAEQLLKSVLILSPSLAGPEMVAEYNALVERCQNLQAEKRKPKKR
jgi:TolA-binding protein